MHRISSFASSFMAALSMATLSLALFAALTGGIAYANSVANCGPKQQQNNPDGSVSYSCANPNNCPAGTSCRTGYVDFNTGQFVQTCDCPTTT